MVGDNVGFKKNKQKKILSSKAQERPLEVSISQIIHGSSRLSPSTMLVLAKKPEEVFKAPLNTKKQAPVTARNRDKQAWRSVANGHQQAAEQTESRFGCGTFARLVVDADGLRLVVPVVVLDAHQVGVGVVVEARPHRQHVVVGLTHGLHQLQGPMTSVSR